MNCAQVLYLHEEASALFCVSTVYANHCEVQMTLRSLVKKYFRNVYEESCLQVSLLVISHIVVIAPANPFSRDASFIYNFPS